MKRPGFFHGVAVAAVFGFVASAAIAALTPYFGFHGVVRLIIPALGLAYLLYLMVRTQTGVGRVTTLAAWSVLAAACWWTEPPLPLYLLIHVAAVWLVRSLYFYSGIVPALMDLGLSALAVAAAVWAVTRTGSVFLAVWTFFLVQALFVAIPPALAGKTGAERGTTPDNGNFRRASRQADAALRQLIAK